MNMYFGYAVIMGLVYGFAAIFYALHLVGWAVPVGVPLVIACLGTMALSKFMHLLLHRPRC